MLLGEVRRLIEEALVMEAGLTGKLRSPGGKGGRQQYKIRLAGIDAPEK